jgi:NAD(P)H-dependent flavin oxidoreductase YrpB (nitropropane dioxygenase family)
MTHAHLKTSICELFGIERPIVQTGMGWVSGARLTAATSAAGGLGILAGVTMTLPQLEASIHKVKDRTNKPFGVNLRADQADMNERIDLMVREGIRVASFARAPGAAVIKKFKDAGILTMPTVGARRHAEKVLAMGVDALIAQGGEGGGHTGTVPTSLLLPEVCDAVDIPVLGAGGFSTGRGLVAALAYGAGGIAMGTRFLLTQESRVPEEVKQTYLATSVTGTVVTTAVDGYPQRVVRTKVVDALERAGWWTAPFRAARYALEFRKLTGTPILDLWREGMAMKKNSRLTWAQTAMAANAPMLTRAALVDGKQGAGILPTGQVVGVIDSLPTVAEVLDQIMEEAHAVLTELTRTLEPPHE